MECSTCRTEVSVGQRFCTACGAPLRIPCAACGHANPPDSKFCGRCGANLAPGADGATTATLAAPGSEAATAAPTAERRQLTILFCDLVGSTVLSARFDPEDLGRIIGSYHRMCADAVTRYGGYVAQYVGDGVVVYFGYPQAHEDDAERALHAALALVDGIGQLSPQVEFALQIRVGIATGLVVVGDIMGDGRTWAHAATGETPNLAARLQAIAEPNTVVISSRTRQLTRGMFEYRDLGPMILKGFEAAVPVWQVVGTSPVQSRFEALREPELTRLVGRQQEVGLLMRLWGDALRGAGRVVVVTGDPGIGKSRLARAFEERLKGESYTRLRYFCSPHHQDSALFPVISHLQRAARFARGDSTQHQYAKLEPLLDRVPTPPEAVGLISELLGLPADGRFRLPALTPQQRREKTLGALLAQVASLATQQPLFMLFEDVHWIDPTSLQLLALIVERAAELRMLLIVTARPEFPMPWPGRAHVSTIRLSHLDQHDGAVLVDRVAGGKTLPHEVLGQILARTDGVPLFVEELTKTVLESGLLREENWGYALSGPITALTIPMTLHDSLMARLDRRPAVREVAQIGAVIGREFSYPLLSAVAELAPDTLRRGLDELVLSELVFVRGEPPQVTYSFKHTLLRDAAYDSLLRNRRAALHARIAAVLEERFPEVGEQQPELIAQHYAEGGLMKQAIVYWSNAGRKSVARSAMAEAATQLRKGLALLPRLPDDPERWKQELQLQTALGSALLGWGAAAEEAGSVYARARELCERLGDVAALMPVLTAQFMYLIGVCQFAAARDVAEHLLRLGEAQNDAVSRLLGTRSMAAVRHWVGEFAPALNYWEETLRLYAPEAHGSLASSAGFDVRTQALVLSSWDLLILGHVHQAQSRAMEALKWTRHLNHYHSLAFGLVHLGIFHSLLRAEDSALAAAEDASTVAAEQGLAHWSARAKVVRGHALAVLGDATRGLTLARCGFAECRSTMYTTTGSFLNEAYYTSVLARTCERAGLADEARSLLANALEIAERAGDGWFVAELHRLLGEWDRGHQRNDPADAEAAFRRAIAVARRQDAKLWELRATISLSRLCADQGRHTEGRDLLAPICAWFTEGFDTPDLRDAAALLNELRDPSRRTGTRQPPPRISH